MFAVAEQREDLLPPPPSRNSSRYIYKDNIIPVLLLLLLLLLFTSRAELDLHNCATVDHRSTRCLPKKNPSVLSLGC